MQSSNQQIKPQYAKLKELVSDINRILQEPNHYEQFDPVIKNAILGISHASNIDQLPQVKLLKDIREKFKGLNEAFQNDDIINLTSHSFELKSIVQYYLLAESTISLSPEFNCKLVTLASFLMKYNQEIRKELNSILQTPQAIFKDNHDEHANIDSKTWHYYHDKVINLLQVLPHDHKLKPYITNLENLLAFIIKLKEEGILRSNLITTILDFVESFNTISHTTIKQIIQDYATLSEKEIRELLIHINHFWESFLPICDEIEIDFGLRSGFLTSHLERVFAYCNTMEVEFDHTGIGSVYPFTQARLARIRHNIDETDKLLSTQQKDQLKLKELNDYLTHFELHGQHNLNALISLHPSIELLTCEASDKATLHKVIDQIVEEKSAKIPLSTRSSETITLSHLINKYKLHEITDEEAELLLIKLQELYVEETDNYFWDMYGEYAQFTNNIPGITEKITKGLLVNKDINHLFIMIHLFSSQEISITQIESIKTSIHGLIENLEEFKTLLNLFESSQLPEQDFYQLLSCIDLLDCDAGLKEKYKKQLVDLDYKRKNSGNLRLLVDFALGFFTEITVPFLEIRNQLEEKIATLQELATNGHQSHLSQQPTFGKVNFLSNFSKLLDNKTEWNQLRQQTVVDLKKNQDTLQSLQSIKAYKEERYQKLANSLSTYQAPPKEPLNIKEPVAKPLTWREYLSDFVKGFLAKSTLLISSVYRKAKSAFSYMTNFFTKKSPQVNIQNDVPMVQKNVASESLPANNKLKSPYKELNVAEENILWLLEKLLDPMYLPSLKDALNKHQLLQVNANMPLFYRQSAEIMNVFILFRKVLLSYSHWDMLQFVLAVSDLHAGNKAIFYSILDNAGLRESYTRFQQTIELTRSTINQMNDDFNTTEVFQTPSSQVIRQVHHSLEIIANNRELNLQPFIKFLKRRVDNTNEGQKEHLQKIYASINKMTQFLEKALNNQQNFLIEALFSLADLCHQYRTLSSSTTELLLKNNFPYVKELSEVMKNLQATLLLFQQHIHQLRESGLNPDIVTSLTNCLENSEKIISQYTPIKLQQKHILLLIDQILSKCGHNLNLQEKMDEIKSRLITEDEERLHLLEKDLLKIQEQINQPTARRHFGFFPRCLNDVTLGIQQQSIYRLKR